MSLEKKSVFVLPSQVNFIFWTWNRDMWCTCVWARKSPALSLNFFLPFSVIAHTNSVELDGLNGVEVPLCRIWAFGLESGRRNNRAVLDCFLSSERNTLWVKLGFFVKEKLHLISV